MYDLAAKEINITPVFVKNRMIGYELDPVCVVLPCGTEALWMGSTFSIEESIGVSVESWNMVFSDENNKLQLRENFVLKTVASLLVRNRRGQIVFVPGGQTLRFSGPVAVEMVEPVNIPAVIGGANTLRSSVTADEMESCEEAH